MKTKKNRLVSAYCFFCILLLFGSAGFAGELFWGTFGYGKVQSCSSDGSNLKTLFTTSYQIHDVALDSNNEHVYLTRLGHRDIWRINYDVSGAILITNTDGAPRNIDVDMTNGKLYWTEQSSDTRGFIKSCDSNGSNVRTLNSTRNSYGLDVDENGQKVYWTDLYNRSICRSDLDGLNLEILSSGHSNPSDIEIDSTVGKVFWLNRFENRVLFCDLDGSNIDTITLPHADHTGIALDQLNQHIYVTGFSHSSPDTIHRINYDGTGLELILIDLEYPAGIEYLPEPIIPINLDIKPGSCPNPLNTKSQGVLPIAILGTEEFEVSTIDVASIFLNGVPTIRSSYEDVGGPVADPNECECTTDAGDGFDDLVLKFYTQQIVGTLGEVNTGDILTLPLTGVLNDGTSIEGGDCVVIVGSHKPINKADINKDGVVNTVDIAIVAENWLQSSAVDE